MMRLSSFRLNSASVPHQLLHMHLNHLIYHTTLKMTCQLKLYNSVSTVSMQWKLKSTHPCIHHVKITMDRYVNLTYCLLLFSASLRNCAAFCLACRWVTPSPPTMENLQRCWTLLESPSTCSKSFRKKLNTNLLLHNTHRQ